MAYVRQEGLGSDAGALRQDRATKQVANVAKVGMLGVLAVGGLTLYLVAKAISK